MRTSVILVGALLSVLVSPPAVAAKKKRVPIRKPGNLGLGARAN